MCRFEEVSNDLISKLTTKNISIIMDVAHNITAIVIIIYYEYLVKNLRYAEE